MDTGVLFIQLMTLLLMITVGFCLRRANWLSDEATTQLNKMVVYIFNPVLVINSVLEKNLSDIGPKLLENIVYVLLFFSILFIVGYPVVKLLRVKKDLQSIYQAAIMFSNVAFFGVPIVSGLYGDNGIVFLTFYILAFNVTVYSIGVWIISKGSKEKVKFKFTSMINVGTLSCVFAVIILFLSIPMPSFVVKFCGQFTAAVVPLSCITVGSILAKGSLKEMFLKVDYRLVIIKMLVIPIVIILCLKRFAHDPVVFGVFVIMLGMPVANIVPMMARLYSSEECELVSIRVMTVTTILSVITLPIVSLFV